MEGSALQNRTQRQLDIRCKIINCDESRSITFQVRGKLHIQSYETYHSHCNKETQIVHYYLCAAIKPQCQIIMVRTLPTAKEALTVDQNRGNGRMERETRGLNAIPD